MNWFFFGISYYVYLNYGVESAVIFWSAGIMIVLHLTKLALVSGDE